MIKKNIFALIIVVVGVTTLITPIKVKAVSAGVTAVLMDALGEPESYGSAGISKVLMDTLHEIRIEELRLQKEKEEAEEKEREEAERKRLEEEEKIRKYEEEMGPYHIYDSPGGSFKSFMSWQNITCRSSMQWKLQNWAAYTDWYTGLREIDGRLCVALGSYYGAPIGAYVDLIMENGSVIKCIMADQKDDKHTDPTNRWHSVDGSVGEFLVETSALPKVVKQMGDISYIHPRYEGNISQIKVYDKIFSFE